MRVYRAVCTARGGEMLILGVFLIILHLVV